MPNSSNSARYLAKQTANSYISLKNNPTSIGFVAYYGWIIYLCGIISGYITGTLIIGPRNFQYCNFGSGIYIIHNFIALLMFIEVMVNWICLKLVSSCCNGEPLTKSTSQRQFGKNGNYFYFDWKPCYFCGIWRPPRVHHCAICQVCILKRDHHCFFTNSCIGLNNQRHFVVFSFWCTLLTSYSLLHATFYIYSIIFVSISLWDLFPPITVIRFLLGYSLLEHVFLICLFYLLLYFVPKTWGFLLEQCICIYKGGITSYEDKFQIQIKVNRNFSQIIRGIFGRFWLLNFLIPLHFVFQTEDNGIDWEGITVNDNRSFFIPVLHLD